MYTRGTPVRYDVFGHLIRYQWVKQGDTFVSNLAMEIHKSGISVIVCFPMLFFGYFSDEKLTCFKDEDYIMNKVTVMINKVDKVDTFKTATTCNN